MKLGSLSLSAKILSSILILLTAFSGYLAVSDVTLRPAKNKKETTSLVYPETQDQWLKLINEIKSPETSYSQKHKLVEFLIGRPTGRSKWALVEALPYCSDPEIQSHITARLRLYNPDGPVLRADDIQPVKESKIAIWQDWQKELVPEPFASPEQKPTNTTKALGKRVED
ncbi:MAG: hypothetical protein COT74_13845 [Bdellovibrionales bacterium CG10_big_fil_rev_8_21_14_0_10_45_34]|nr:MAG: hypothetical protein COT74_13845 [Bdellovibrionales bacterium CG10_big_fil_rev_8_21_14_0_10_45_34]